MKRKTIPILLIYNTQTSWLVYPPEFIFSEKLQTFVDRSSTNSRGKDIYDMGILFDQCDTRKLITAINETFNCRSTDIPESFLKVAKDTDTNVLRNSWNSVRFMSEESTFDESWKLFLKRLKDIDAAILKN